MKLQEIFDQLSAGEFSQISFGGAEAGVIDETNHAKIIGHVNLGLTALYKRFTLKENRLTLALQDGQTLYRLHSSFAVNVQHSIEPVRYIIDTATDKFRDDILKIEKVLTDDTAIDRGVSLEINKEGDDYSVFTPTSTQLRVPTFLVGGEILGVTTPTWAETDNLTVIYRANHPKLAMPYGFIDACRLEIQLPESHLEALLFYIASRVQSPIGMTQEGAVSAQYFARYEQACQALEAQGMQVNQGGTNDKLTRAGWA